MQARVKAETINVSTPGFLGNKASKKAFLHFSNAGILPALFELQNRLTPEGSGVTAQLESKLQGSFNRALKEP